MGFKLSNTANNSTDSNTKESSISELLQKDISFGKPALSNKLKEQFYTEISLLLSSGISLKKALELIKDSSKKNKHKQIFETLLFDIIGGLSFSEAIKKHKTFSDYEYYSIKIGEESGNLVNVLDQLSDFYSRKNKQRQIIINALSYPAILIFTTGLVLAFMLSFVVPMFQDIFKQHNIQLPLITQIIIYISGFLKSYGLIIVFAVSIFVFSQPYLNKNKHYKSFKDNLKLKIPLLGNFIKMVYLAQFTQAIALLTSAKVPIVQGITLIKEMIAFQPLKNDLDIVEKEILLGKSFSESLSQTKLFDSRITAMIKVAEETNQNELIFKRLSEQYNNQIEYQSKTLTSVLEPFILVFIGSIVGCVIISMYWPMFKMNDIF